MKALKSARTLAASLGVLAVGALAATPAQAFDDIDWDWKKDVNEKVDIDVYIDVDVESTGLVEVEKLQIFLGDAKATATVEHIYNNPLYEGAGRHDDYYSYDPKKRPSKDGGDGYGDINVPIALCNYNFKICQLNIFIDDDGKQHDRWSKDWAKVPVKPLDARYELPIIENTAQAIGNNQSITSDVPVFLHDGQFVANVRDKDDPKPCTKWCDLMAGLPTSTSTSNLRTRQPEEPEGNLHHTVALLFGLGAVLHVLEHAEIEADATAQYLKNVSVDNSATAVANNIGVTLASDVDGSYLNDGSSDRTCKDRNKCDVDRLSNHVVIADITQFALANVTATATTSHVSATGYDHMRQLTTATLQTRNDDPDTLVKVPTPWISNRAQAVGNNVSITVGRDLTN